MRYIIHDINNMAVMDHLAAVYNRRFVEDRLPVDICESTTSGECSLPRRMLFGFVKP